MTVKTGTKVHALVEVKNLPYYSAGKDENGEWPTKDTAVTACHTTYDVETIGDHGEVTCGNCLRVLAKAAA